LGSERETLERHADELLAAGAAGIVAVSTTGEATALHDDERAAVTSVCARVCSARDAVLIVGAGTYNTRETIERHGALADVPSVRASLAVVPITYATVSAMPGVASTRELGVSDRKTSACTAS